MYFRLSFRHARAVMMDEKHTRRWIGIRKKAKSANFPSTAVAEGTLLFFSLPCRENEKKANDACFLLDYFVKAPCERSESVIASLSDLSVADDLHSDA